MKRLLPWLLLSSALLNFSYAPFPAGFLAWVGLVPFFIVLERNEFKSGFRIGYVAGLLLNGMVMHWLLFNVGVDSAFEAAATYLMTVLYLSLFFGLFGMVQSFVCRMFGPAGFLAAPFFWTSMEFLQSIGELKFTWLSLAYSQTYYTRIAQFIEFTGMFGLTFWIVCLNLFVFLMVRNRANGPLFPLLKTPVLAAVFAALLLVPTLYGVWAVPGDTFPVQKKVRVAVIQPDIDPVKKWRQARLAFTTLMTMTEQLAAAEYDLVIWPETATPVRLRRSWIERTQIYGLVDSLDAALLMGVPDRRLSPQGTLSSFNSAFLFHPGEKRYDTYDKVNLVPFGEYVPRFLSFLDELAMDVGVSSFYPGDSATVFGIQKRSGDSGTVRFGTAICFESVFPEYVRSFVEKGAEFIVVITNDAWYNGFVQPGQHSQMSVLRAIELRTSVVRCANSGVSAIIDPYGRIVAETRNPEQVILNGIVPVLGEETAYARNGHAFNLLVLIPAVAVLMAGFGFLLKTLRKNRAAKKQGL